MERSPDRPLPSMIPTNMGLFNLSLVDNVIEISIDISTQVEDNLFLSYEKGNSDLNPK